MPKLHVTTRDGAEHAIESAPGLSVMEVIRNGGIDDLLALCGGSRSCATCHIYVDAAGLPPMSPEEDELLDSSGFRRPESRLSCQIIFAAGLDGLRVTVAPED